MVETSVENFYAQSDSESRDFVQKSKLHPQGVEPWLDRMAGGKAKPPLAVTGTGHSRQPTGA